MIMKEPSSGSRAELQDPIASKMHLNNFSSSATRKSQLQPRKNEAEDQIFCELCLKSYKILTFRDHIQEHRRTPKPKLPSSKQIYANFYEINQSDLDSETIIHALDSKNHIVLEQTEYHYQTFYGPSDFLNQRSSYKQSHSPVKEKLKFSVPSSRRNNMDDF